ncbi:MAG: galactose mutarotase [Rhodobacteraceae bacterium]|nr:MAG: galactose mutarotase [Paracoccaceae bacterium]
MERITDLGTAPDGKPFRGIAIGGPDLSARVLTFGAALQDLRLAGHAPPLVLGYAEPRGYFDNPHKLGAVVGRCANRIAGGQFTLDGRTHRLDRNDGGVQTLHGGADGVQNKSWDLADHGPGHVSLGLHLPGGHMGFPGALDLLCTYRVAGAALEIELQARTDAPTYCNLTNHSYFTLTGAPTTRGHRLRIAAEEVLELDARMIPTGRPVPVAGTGLDFRRPAAPEVPLDHNFCLAETRRALTPVAVLEAAGLSMTLSTTEPGLQVYDGRALDRTGQAGLCGGTHGPHAGIALEPQAWPDAPNQPWSAQALLRPGETYRHLTRLAFSRPASS